MPKPRVLIADDHKIVLEGLRRLLSAEFDVLEAVGDGRELLEAADRLRPDVIVADISMPNLNGIEAVRQIKKSNENVKIVLLTMHAEVAYARGGFEAGASGYVLKHSAPDELIVAIREALQGRTYVTPLIAGGLLRSYREEAYQEKEPSSPLSSRQREILQLLAEGHSLKDISAILHVSPKTVEYHKYRMMELLGIHTSADLVRYAVKQGIPEPPVPRGKILGDLRKNPSTSWEK
jgi:DNA-binding NarL/FixJ family response regulator